MAVLNTTSPRASPSAPAATPRYQVPSSSAKSASIALMNAQGAKNARKNCLCGLGGLRVPPSSLQRRRHAGLLARDNANGARPVLVTIVFETDGVVAGGNRGRRQGCCPNQLAVEKHASAGRPRIDGQDAATDWRGWRWQRARRGRR